MPLPRIRETRSIFECRATEEAGQRVVTGYATPFGEEAMIGGWFYEKSRKGCFKKTIREKAKAESFDIKILWNHEDSLILGRQKNKSLTLKEEDYGLAYRWVVPDTARAIQAYDDIRLGIVDEMSFRFSVIKEEWTKDDEEIWHRELKEVELYEVSPVVWPAYQGTGAEANSAVNEDQFRSILQQAEQRGHISAAEAAELINKNEVRQDASTPEPGPGHSASTAEPNGDSHSAAGTKITTLRRRMDIRDREFNRRR